MSSLPKVFRILEHLAANEQASVTELAKAVALPAATVHRLLASLAELGYVEQEAATRRYLLSMRILQLSGPVLERSSVRKAARPLMERLSADWNETVNLGLLKNDRIIYAETIQSTQALRIGAPLGDLGEGLDPYCSAMGKAICAGLDPSALDRVLPQGPLRRFTPRTITSRSALAAELQAIRDRGYAVDDEERYDGVRSVAAAIRDRHGDVVGAISIAGPTNRVTPDLVRRIGLAVVDAAAHASAGLGHVPDDHAPRALRDPDGHARAAAPAPRRQPGRRRA